MTSVPSSFSNSIGNCEEPEVGKMNDSSAPTSVDCDPSRKRGRKKNTHPYQATQNTYKFNAVSYPEQTTWQGT